MATPSSQIGVGRLLREWRTRRRRTQLDLVLDVILTGHEPNPAVVVDRGWNLVAANSAMLALAEWVDPALLEPPVNVMRVGLHPRGLAAGIVNLGEVRAYFVGRLERRVAITRDEGLAALLGRFRLQSGDAASRRSAGG